MWIYQIGRVIAERRHSLGMTEALLARLAAVNESDVIELENGNLQDISHNSLCRMMAIIGLAFDIPSLQARCAKQGLEMAARTSSIRYKQELDAENLKEILKTAKVPDRYRTNMIHFFDEAPLPLVILAAEEASQELLLPEMIWGNMRQLALELDSDRKDLWIN